jgi:hypothetical protein
MQKLYQVIIHNDSLESQALGYMEKVIAERLVDDLRRILNPGHIVELSITDDEMLENEG